MPKLLIELVPSTSWGNNLRSLLSRATWDVLRRETYALAGNRCEVCGGQGYKGRLEAHERWVYDDAQHVQKLVGLEALCPRCHEVRHFGRACAVGQGERAMEHLVKVNGWTLPEAMRHVQEAFDLHESRSRYEWTLELAWLEAKGIHAEAP